MSTQPTVPAARPAPGRLRLAPGAGLWASAFVLAALVVIQAGRLGGGQARADLITGIGGLTAMTVEATTEDVLLVSDSRSEQLMVYKVVNQNNLELFKTYHLPRMFSDARARASGSRR